MANPLRRLFDPGDWLAVKPRLDPEERSLRIEHRPDPNEYKLRIYLGLFVLTLAAVVVALIDDNFGRLVACGFGFFGLLNLIYGVIQSRFEMSLAITPDEVKVRRRTLFGARDWNEPLSNYRGVLLRESQVRKQSVGNIETNKRYQIIELAHDNPERTVPLYVSEGADVPYAVHAAFAERLRLPALAEDAVRGSIDAEAEARGPAVDPGPPPSGVEVSQDGDTTRISVGMSALGRTLTPLFYLTIVAMFGFVGYQIEPMAGLLAGGMATLLFAMMFGLSRLMNRDSRPPAICMTQERVWIDRPAPKTPAFVGTIRTAMQQAAGVEFPEINPVVESLPLKAIARIRVDVYSGRDGDGSSTPNPRLLIEAEAGRLEFMAAQFDEGKLDWVRRFLEWRIGDY